MEAPKTLIEAIKLFSDYENCRQFMIMVRWADGVVRCPQCQSDKVTYLANPKAYKCRTNHLKQKFTLKTGTVMENSPIGLDRWLSAFWLLSNSKNGISSHELGRSLGVTQKSAWFMLQRVRLAMQDGFDGGKQKSSRSGRNVHWRQGSQHAPRQAEESHHGSWSYREDGRDGNAGARWQGQGPRNR